MPSSLFISFLHCQGLGQQLNDGTLQLPARAKDYPDRDRLAMRFERFKAAA